MNNAADVEEPNALSVVSVNELAPPIKDESFCMACDLLCVDQTVETSTLTIEVNYTLRSDLKV